MLLELTVRGLGVIDETTLSFGPGLTALTGETGAGKTLLVDALALVMGGRPPRGIVADGGAAYVEATFARPDGTEVILAREIPAEGRAKAWIDGRACSLAVLGEQAAGLCDIYGQHEHQSLLSATAIRRALDAFGGIDRTDLVAARAAVRDLEAERDALGGDPEELVRECALLDHQVGVIDAAAIQGPDEVDDLLVEAALRGDAVRLRSVLASGLEELEGHERGGARDHVARLRSEILGHAALGVAHEALLDAEVALEEAASRLREALESIEADPVRASVVDERLKLLHDLTRMHGPTLADVLATRTALVERSAALRSSIERQSSLTDRLAEATRRLRAEEEELLSQRRDAAPRLCDGIRAHLPGLALARSEVDVRVDGPAGEKVELLFSANRGHAPQPVSAVASGGELARLMLALRLTLPGGPSCMVFDEVDAGIGGSTALVLASALAEVATDRQVLVVTHLAQVAARASGQVTVIKVAGERDAARAQALDEEGRVGELARMLSGQPNSDAARRHARELLGAPDLDAAQLPLV